MLQNCIYRGETVHKGKSYPGEHEAIVDEALWNAVQATLTGDPVGSRRWGLASKEAKPVGWHPIRCREASG